MGIMRGGIGFKVRVDMCGDGGGWKKGKVGRDGVRVVEYEEDYGVGVEEGGKGGECEGKCLFIDEENWGRLLVGYWVGGEGVKGEFGEEGGMVDGDKGVFVYVGCGAGGGRGGVGSGVKVGFGDDVEWFFGEGREWGCMLLGVDRGLEDEICVEDIGMEKVTGGDGVGVGGG